MLNEFQKNQSVSWFEEDCNSFLVSSDFLWLYARGCVNSFLSPFELVSNPLMRVGLESIFLGSILMESILTGSILFRGAFFGEHFKGSIWRGAFVRRAFDPESRIPYLRLEESDIGNNYNYISSQHHTTLIEVFYNTL